ncbi:MAG: AAA family ATPase [Chloroflexota bacterium]
MVEALAKRIVDGAVPEQLMGTRIVELPVANLIAGTMFRGQLEQRLTEVIAEVQRRPDIVLFIDEVHMVISQSEIQNLANILKPALARPGFRMIGATTPKEFDASIRRDPALERRTQAIEVREPTSEETIALLEVIIGRTEAHHGVVVEPKAIEAAVALSVAYMRDRRLPDKAIDLLEDACTRVVMPSLGQPPDDGRPLVVTPEVVAESVSARTGIPVGRLAGGAELDAAHIEQVLRKRVLGQDEAVDAVAAAVRLSALGLRAPERPRGVFLLGGPTGVGKTALAQALAEGIGGGRAGLLRLDLSEYHDQYTVSRLIGSPPGYIGHDDGGQLTKHLQTHPASVVLLDEIEKGHPRVLDIFLQVFDAGRLTDGRGRTVDARHAWFFLTTNLRLDDPEEVARALRPEFVNRLDRMVVFSPLDAPTLLGIAEREVRAIETQLGERIAGFGLDRLALVALIRDDEDGTPVNGRTIIRRVEQEVAMPLADLLAQRERDAASPVVTVSQHDGVVRVSVEDAG